MRVKILKGERQINKLWNTGILITDNVVKSDEIRSLANKIKNTIKSEEVNVFFTGDKEEIQAWITISDLYRDEIRNAQTLLKYTYRDLKRYKNVDIAI